MSVSTRVRSRLASLTAAVTLAALVGSLTGQPPAAAQQPSRYQKLKPQAERSVPAAAAPAKPARPADPAQAAAVKAAPPAPVWPAATSSTVDTSTVDDRRAVAGGGVRAGAVTLDRAHGSAAAPPRSVRVSMLDRTAAAAAHQPVVLRLARADGAPDAASVRVGVDYSGFRAAFGADWPTRLRLVQLPECALVTPAAAGCQPVPLVSS